MGLKTRICAPGNCSAFVATGDYTKHRGIVMGHNNWTNYAVGSRGTDVRRRSKAVDRDGKSWRSGRRPSAPTRRRGARRPAGMLTPPAGEDDNVGQKKNGSPVAYGAPFSLNREQGLQRE